MCTWRMQHTITRLLFFCNSEAGSGVLLLLSRDLSASYSGVAGNHPCIPCVSTCLQLDKRVDRHQAVAKELLHEGRKDRALLALKKKKMTVSSSRVGGAGTEVFLRP